MNDYKLPPQLPFVPSPIDAVAAQKDADFAWDLTRHMRRLGAPRPWRHMLNGPPFVGPPAPNHPRVAAWLKKHPFRPVPTKQSKWTVLRKEAFKIYRAIAFAMRHHGVVMNVHLTIAWGYLGVVDGEQAACMLTRFNHEVAKWLKVGSIEGRIQKRRWRPVGVESSEHMYVYVHEWGRRHGLHTHELAFIPPEKRQAFEAWARSCLARLCGRDHIPTQALRITGPKRASEHQRVWLCWTWFRYITKTMDPTWYLPDPNGKLVLVRDVFHPRPFYNGNLVTCDQLASGSRNIWTKAQAQAGFRSRLDQPDAVDIYDGAELDERRLDLAWQAEEARQAERHVGLQTLNL